MVKNNEEYQQVLHNKRKTCHKISEVIYPFMESIIDKYQKNYKGEDKMSKEYMMGEIEKFKPRRDDGRKA